MQAILGNVADEARRLVHCLCSVNCIAFPGARTDSEAIGERDRLVDWQRTHDVLKVRTGPAGRVVDASAFKSAAARYVSKAAWERIGNGHGGQRIACQIFDLEGVVNEIAQLRHLPRTGLSDEERAGWRGD